MNISLTIYPPLILSFKNAVVYIIAITACIHLKDKINGEIIYKEITLKKFNNIVLYNTLIHFFGVINDVIRAKYIFDNMSIKTIVSYTAMMKAYLSNKYYKQCLDLFSSNEIKTSKDKVCYLVAINACVYSKDKNKADDILNEILRINMTDMEIFADLIHLFGDIKDVNTAETIFNRIEINNVTTIVFNSMLRAFIDNDEFTKATELYQNNQFNHLKNHAFYFEILKICGRDNKYLALLDDIYSEIKSNDSINIMNDYKLISQLITYFGKLGNINECELLFHNFTNQETINNGVISVFNAMIGAYTKVQNGSKALQLYDTLKYDAKYQEYWDNFIKINNGTEIGIMYLSLINICCHAGMIDDIETIYQEYITIVNDNPYKNKRIHHMITTSIIDSFSRKGLLEKAHNFLNSLE